VEELIGLLIWAAVMVGAAIVNRKKKGALRGPAAPVPQSTGGDLGSLLESLQRGLTGGGEQSAEAESTAREHTGPETHPGESVAAVSPPPVPASPVLRKVAKVEMYKNPYRVALRRGSRAGLREGVVWAEVLGAPRGLRDFGGEQ
jgi:hypothetical protein